MTDHAPTPTAILDQIVALRQALYRLVQEVDHLYSQVQHTTPARPQACAPCPVCGAVNLHVDATDFLFVNRGDVALKLVCRACQTRWKARYRLHTYEQVERQS